MFSLSFLSSQEELTKASKPADIGLIGGIGEGFSSKNRRKPEFAITSVIVNKAATTSEKAVIIVSSWLVAMQQMKM